MQRRSGVLMHISSLFGEFSCGGFGAAAKYFADMLADCGFSYWQTLPFCMTDEYNSPYKSYSSFSGNPFFVDLEVLRDKGLLTDAELDSARQRSPWLCEFDRLKRERFELLKKAALRVRDRTEADKFVEDRPQIDAFCRFMALKEANGGAPWQEWTVDTIDTDVLFAWKFIQYEFFEQWKKIKEYVNSRGIKLVGDIPIYVASDSADVWCDRELFQLDASGMPTHVAGVSPDYFCQDGQLWGNPLYDWEAMKKDGYRWWCDRMRHMSELFDAVRIDHFRGLEAYWSIPADAASAKEGKWIKGPGFQLVEVLKAAVPNTQIIAEDLGDITPEVYQMVVDSGLPGMRVFQFGFLSEGDSIHRPHNYPANCVAYTGTHDNNTLLGYLWELDDDTRRRVLEYCGHAGDWKCGCDSIIRTMLASHAGLVILPVQDLLGYGCDTRINTPGRPDGNWAYRVTREQLDSIDRARFRRLNEMYSRT